MISGRDTIFALSSGRPPAAIAVVRISGPQAGMALQKLIGRLPEPRKAALARVRDPSNGEIIDEALALWFPAPNSETGEDIAELQLHGGRAVIAGVLAALARLHRLRPADAGEFTRRAFENGRLDLTAVEGLADLIYAETEAQRRQAFRQLKGLLGDRAEAWRGRLIEALALVEAGIDFSDEADVPEDLIGPALKIAQGLRQEIAEALAGSARGERLRDGLVVAIAGPPNAGKSTLLNRIARREAAIVSPVAGTTRDVIEVHLDLDGYPVTVLDTAGIRDSNDPVEQEGVRRARERASAADLVLWVVEAGQPLEGSLGSSPDFALRPPVLRGASTAPDIGPPPATMGLAGTGARGPGIVRRAPMAPDIGSPTTWIVRNKIDLAKLPAATTSNDEATAANKEMNKNNNTIEYYIEHIISASLEIGMNELMGSISRYVAEFFGSEPALVSRERHRQALNFVLAALDRALAESSSGREDIIAEELRLAAGTLGRLIGRIDVEDILDVIFRDFCIGK